MGVSRSKIADRQVVGKNEEDSRIGTTDLPEVNDSVHISDLIESGRYKVASQETIQMMKAIQQPREQNVIYPDTEIKDLKQYITEQEGLNIGAARRKALSQQWRFFLSCEPVQRGLDAGIIVGSVAAAATAYANVKYRVPSTIGLIWIGGFCVGMVSVPMMVIAADSYNTKRIKKLEREMFLRQREDFYSKLKGD